MCREIHPSLIQLRRLTTLMTGRDDYDDKVVKGEGGMMICDVWSAALIGSCRDGRG
jgi:hypothetical protein